MKYPRLILLILAVASSRLVTSSPASVITVPNGDFSTGNSGGSFAAVTLQSGNSYTFNTTPSVWQNWTLTDISAPNFTAANTDPHGNNVNSDAEVYYGSGGIGTVTISQTLATQVAPNTIYTMSTDFTRWNSSYTLPETIDLRLLVGGVELAGGVLTTQTLQDSSGVNPVNFVTWTKKYTTGGLVTPGALQVEVYLDSTTVNPTFGKVLFFDNVTLDATLVPEPSTLLLLVAGGLLVRRRLAPRRG